MSRPNEDATIKSGEMTFLKLQNQTDNNTQEEKPGKKSNKWNNININHSSRMIKFIQLFKYVLDTSANSYCILVLYWLYCIA